MQFIWWKKYIDVSPLFSLKDWNEEIFIKNEKRKSFMLKGDYICQRTLKFNYLSYD